MLSITRATLQSFCRVCLCELLANAVTPNHDMNKNRLIKVVQSISGVKMKGSEQNSELYPQSICHSCYIKTNAFLKFRDRAIIATGVLKMLKIENLQESALLKLKSYCRVCRRKRENDSEECYTIEKYGDLYNYMNNCTGLILAEQQNSKDLLREDIRYPSHLCRYCYMTLKNFIEFRAVARQTDEYLQVILDGGEVNQEGFRYQTEQDFTDRKKIEVTNEESEFDHYGEYSIGVQFDCDMPMEIEMEESESEIQVDTNECKTELSTSTSTKKNRKMILNNFTKTSSENLSNGTDKVDLNEASTEPATNLDEICIEKTLNVPSYEDNSTISNEDFINRLHMGAIQPRNFENVFKCKQCDKRFYKKYLFEAHVMAAHEGIERPFACPHCPSTFRIILLLNRHIRAKHSLSDGREKILHDCMFCQRQYTRKDHLKEHIRAVHEGFCPFKCSVCGKTFGSKNVQIRHEQNHSEMRPYKCEHCNKRYNNEFELKTHVQRHIANPDLLCPICKRSKPNAEELQKHIAMHEAPRQHQCSKCGKIFSKLVNLREHDTTVHLKLRPFKCCHCGLAFGARKSLKLHERKHDPTGRSEHCSICKLYFETKRALLLHINKIHSTEKDSKHTINS